jgi:hypothetical protein
VRATSSSNAAAESPDRSTIGASFLARSGACTIEVM